MANEPATTGSGTTGRYTHRAWLEEMKESVTILNTIGDQLEVMDSSLAAVEAGKTQRALMARAMALVAELRAGAVTFTGQVDERYRPHGEAIAGVGGPEEVAKKQYNTTG
jgi:hypothetical protein